MFIAYMCIVHYYTTLHCDLTMVCSLIAVVTGSTHGIGKAYAQELANCGVNIIIISLGQEDCEATAKSLGNHSVTQHRIKINREESF